MLITVSLYVVSSSCMIGVSLPLIVGTLFLETLMLLIALSGVNSSCQHGFFTKCQITCLGHFGFMFLV